jgi:hypothetical protein
MRQGAKWVRTRLTFVYLVVAFGTLFYATASQLCFGGDLQGHFVTTLLLALVFTAWNMFASACGALAIALIQKPAYNSFTAPIVSAVVAGVGFTWFPLWIYEESGGFAFDTALTGVTCFFTEGHAIVFTASVLAMTTLLSEWVSLNVRKQPAL